MDFSNERYVRLYTRETTTWRLLGWEGQVVLPQVLRLVDRSGVLDLGRREPAEAVAAHLPGWPREVIATGLAALLAEEVLEHHGNALVWPRFLEAQECAQSDAQRQRESRARRRDTAGRCVTECDVDVTECNQSVTDCNANVTAGHSVSQRVTPSVPNQPNQPEEDPADKPPARPGVLPPEASERTHRTNGSGGFRDWCHDTWGKRYGQPPTWAKKDLVALETVWKKLGDDEARNRWRRYLQTEDDFFAGHPPCRFGSEPDRFTDPKRTASDDSRAARLDAAAAKDKAARKARERAKREATNG